MDPLSIGAAAASLAVSCMKVASVLYTYIEEAKSVDDNVKSLSDEVRSLSTVSDAIHKTWTQNERVATACANDDTELWSNVKLTLDDCTLIVKKLNAKTERLQQPGTIIERAFLRKPILSVRLSLKTRDIDLFRQQIHSHYSAIQSCLLTIQVCLQLDQNASQNTIERTLTQLLSYLENTKLATELGGPYSTFTKLDKEEARISIHLQEFVRNTKWFHSSTSTVVGTKTVARNDSVMGNPLDREEKQRIIDYIAAVNEDDEEDSQTSKPKNLRQVSGQISLPLDLVLAKRCLKLAMHNFQQQDWPKTQEYLETAVTLAGEEQEILKNISAIKIVLAHTYALQEKWDDLETVIVPGLGISEKDEALKLDLLSMLYLQRKDYSTALETCRTAVQLKWSLYGEIHALSFFSVSLLAEIYITKGDNFQADLWLDFIPQDLRKRRLKPSPSDSVFLTAVQPAVERVRAMSMEKVVEAVPDPYVGVAGAGNTSRTNLKDDKLRSRISTQRKTPSAEKDHKVQLQAIQHKAGASTRPAQRTESTSSEGLRSSELAAGRIDFVAKVEESKLCNRTFEGHDRNVTTVAFSPNGKLIASGSADRTVRVWDTATGKNRMKLIGHSNSIHSVAFSPNSLFIASASDDETIRLWYAATGRLRRKLEGHSGFVNSVAFSPDSRLIASASMDKTVKLWDVLKGKLRATLENHSDLVSSVAFSPNGRLVASGSNDGTVCIWDTANGVLCHALKGHSEFVSTVAFSQDSQFVASGSRDRSIRVWDAASGSLCRVLEGSYDVHNVVFSPDGRLMASGLSNGSVQLWDATTGAKGERLLGHSEDVFSVAFSPDGKLVASGSADKTVRLWGIEKPS